MKQLTVDSMKEILPFLKKNAYMSANYNLVTLFLWSVAYPTYFHIEDGALFIFEYDGDEMVAMMPITTNANLSNALFILKRLFKESEKPFLIRWAPEQQAMTARALGYSIDEMSEYKEYIYHGETFRELKGKKMQKKRNNYNYFVKNYNATFRQLQKDDFPDVLNLLNEWFESKDEINHFIKGEMVGIQLLLQLYDDIGYKIGGVFIEGKLKGFSIASYLNENCAEVNIEKADGQIRGLYTYLAVSMQNYFFADVELINREDDAGDENLRKSKMSYQPCAFARVYQITCA